ncbi:MAG: SDR family NAD(P)-dependent oxidoreductase [Dehalococcoidia bacterium]|jgi:NAD(P)-dependent dehydrogenase (short-subunit alcohol dehydrogenase family)|nr:SDR family NAD(P)-dependent oxidoreductase [Dehalococcoidia bacterium]
MGRLDGRVALVTGGGRGIGRAIALEMAREGATIAVASRTEAQLESVVAKVRELGSDGLALPADAMLQEEAQGAVHSTLEAFGQLDILVNNVGGGVTRSGPADHDPFTGDEEVFVDNITLNLVTHYWATRAALPSMREREFGRIISIGSGYAKRSGGGLAYTAAKHGLIGFTRSLAGYVAPYGITVNCLCPGWTNTDLIDIEAMAERMGTDVEGAKANLANDNLLDRILEPEELGPMAALLAAPESAGITGQVISVDGGYKV